MEWNGLFYDQHGDGPPLLLIHAGVADGRMWDDQIPALSPLYRVIRPDLRGFGHSPLPPRAFCHHEDLTGLLRALGHRRACIVGASFGGAVAIDAAIAHPEAVSSLILVSPALGGYEPTSEVLSTFSAREEEALERGDLDGATELNLKLWVDGPEGNPDRCPAGLRERVRAMQRHAFSLPAPEGVSIARLDPPAIGRLGEIRCRTLVVSGALDVPEFLEIASIAATGITGAETVTAPDAAHLPSMEKPQWFNSLVLGYLDGVADCP
jgi:3-oxoadipate enol-lactonase